MAYNVKGLLLRWHSLFLSLERHAQQRTLAEDKYKS
jgi:hypothetical protein